MLGVSFRYYSAHSRPHGSITEPGAEKHTHISVMTSNGTGCECYSAVSLFMKHTAAMYSSGCADLTASSPFLQFKKKKSLYVKTVKLLSLVVGPHTPSPTTSAMKENTWKSFYSSHKHDCADRHRTRRQRCSSVSCEPHTNMHKVPAETDFTDSR